MKKSRPIPSNLSLTKLMILSHDWSYAIIIMESIEPKCTAIKHNYDACFNVWFSEKFLKGDIKIPENCENLFSRYQNCIKKKVIEEIGINERIIDY